MTIDLRVPKGRDVFLRLVEDADVVITNFKPGTMEEWGLGYSAAAARNERIVYAMGSSFGPEGPDAGREGADLSVILPSSQQIPPAVSAFVEFATDKLRSVNQPQAPTLARAAGRGG